MLERLDLGIGFLHRAVFLPAMWRHLQPQNKDLSVHPELKHDSLAQDAPS